MISPVPPSSGQTYIISSKCQHALKKRNTIIISRQKMSADMDPEEMEEWRTIFNLFDVDGDESITCEVNRTAMAQVY